VCDYPDNPVVVVVVKIIVVIIVIIAIYIYIYTAREWLLGFLFCDFEN
jgi:hypothetical protein